MTIGGTRRRPALRSGLRFCFRVAGFRNLPLLPLLRRGGKKWDAQETQGGSGTCTVIGKATFHFRSSANQYPSFGLSLNLPSTSCPIRWTSPSDNLIVSAAARFFTPFLARHARTVTVLSTLSEKSFLCVPLRFRVESETVSNVHVFTVPFGSFTSR